VEAAYSQPLELRYQGERIELSPQTAGFQLDIQKMLPPGAPLDWAAFLDYLQGKTTPPLDTPLEYTIDRDRLRRSLEDIAARYDQPAAAARPVPASFQWEPGRPGKALDITSTLPLVEEALPSLDSRTVNLPVQTVDPPRPPVENLEIQLQQILAASGYSSLIDLYFHDLESGAEFQFARRGSEEIHLPPDIAFSASSMIKIPILLSVFRRLEGSPDTTTDGWLSAMFRQSSNEAADAAMRYLIDEVRGPLVVTEDLQELGLENTFLAGFFAPGSPLLQIYQTPANERAGVNTHPDLYNQTAPGDIGRLLAAINTCAESGSGPILETFPEEFTQEKCQAMIEYMKQDREPYMLEAALPEATPPPVSTAITVPAPGSSRRSATPGSCSRRAGIMCWPSSLTTRTCCSSTRLTT
jgi:hypothetical protein